MKRFFGYCVDSEKLWPRNFSNVFSIETLAEPSPVGFMSQHCKSFRRGYAEELAQLLYGGPFSAYGQVYLID